MEGCPWVTYGRLRPAAVNALVYGFALQASFALAFWLIVRLGRTTLDAPLVVTAAGKIWNLAVTVGVLGILAGDGTGFELLEFPRYAALGLFASYACLAGWAIVTLHQRTERSLYVSLLFVLASLLWFPWILSTAHGFALGWRPPGVVPAVVAGWFVQNLLQIVLTGSALAVLFYFVPKTVNRPLVDKNFAQSGFWLFLLVGGRVDSRRQRRGQLPRHRARARAARVPLANRQRPDRRQLESQRDVPLLARRHARACVHHGARRVARWFDHAVHLLRGSAHGNRRARRVWSRGARRAAPSRCAAHDGRG
jgi:cbb3-type cytochrome oxidase subunit 1